VSAHTLDGAHRVHAPERDDDDEINLLEYWQILRARK